jgi:histidinol phosphatase-like PHP family hydrolase
MINCHCHSNISYCADESMTLELIAEFVRNADFIEQTAVTDHSFAIYFPSDVAWSWSYMQDSTIFDKFENAGTKKLLHHISDMKKYSELIPGVEVELMHDGRFTLDESLLPEIDIVIGSVHWLNAPSDPGDILKYWEKHTLQILEKNVDILGHPYRWIVNTLGSVPEKSIMRIAKAALDTNTALELNSHYEIDTDIAMLRIAAEFNIPIAFSIDAHWPSELKNFDYHYQVIKNAGLSLNELTIFNLNR